MDLVACSDMATQEALTHICPGTTKSFVLEIVLVGGSTRIPKVQQLLKDFFGVPFKDNGNSFASCFQFQAQRAVDDLLVDALTSKDRHHAASPRLPMRPERSHRRYPRRRGQVPRCLAAPPAEDCRLRQAGVRGSAD